MRTKPSKGDHVIITAFGRHRAGILTGIANAVFDAGCNIIDVSQKILQEYVTLIVIADAAPMQITLAQLQDQLNQVGREQAVCIAVQHERTISPHAAPVRMGYELHEVLDTVRITEIEHFDFRAVTLGVSLLDCTSTVD